AGGGWECGATAGRPPAGSFFASHFFTALDEPPGTPPRWTISVLETARDACAGVKARGMSDAKNPRRATITALWWIIWLGYAVGWTLALLTPQPVHVRDAVM